MDGVLGALSWVQLTEWVVLALVSANLWRKQRDATAAWLATAFVSLAMLVVLAQAIGEADLGGWVVKALIVLILGFPYQLYRFASTMLERRRVEWIIAHALTLAVLVATVLLPRLPEPDEPRPTWFALYAVLIAAQWSFLLGTMTWRLWRAGGKQASVARKRIRLMATGALILAAILVFAAFGPTSEEATTPDLVVSIVTITVGPIFLLGFAPPAFLRSLWRRKEEAAMRQMEIDLVTTVSREEVAQSLLTAVVNLLGGSGAALVDADGDILGRPGLSDDELVSLLGRFPERSEIYDPAAAGDAHFLRMEHGWLIVKSGPLTPFFGTEELQVLSASAVFGDLALGRAELFELEIQAREAMRDFVAIASHELRTPTTVIQGYSQLLESSWNDLSEEQKREASRAISRQVGLLDRLIADLLTASKLDVNEIDVHPARVDIRRAIHETLEAVAPDAGFDISVGEGPLVEADPDHVLQILSNYVRNALVYGSPPYVIEVTSDRDRVTVFVRDHGPGVPEAFVPKLFGKFARVDKKKSRSVQGTGLGLSIVRGLARANGGDAWYERNDPDGACFAFQLRKGG